MLLHRRHFLQGSLAAAAGTALPWRLALAGAESNRRLVLVVLRGGLDGLAAVAPYGDPSYRSLRGALALSEPGRTDGVLDLGGFFGLHPNLKFCHELYERGELAILHAIASPYRERSHFDAQDLLENGTDSPRGANDGWLNRALKLMQSGERQLGLAVGDAVPLVLRGDVPVATWEPSVLPGADPDFLQLAAELYGRDEAFYRVFQAGLEAKDLADQVLGSGSEMDLFARGQEQVRLLVQAAGRLLADSRGPRIAVFDLPGWDTHANQGRAGGRLGSALSQLDQGMSLLMRELGPIWRETVVLVVTEFGRTAAPNGSGGTDHGTAGVALVAGGAVAGGHVLASWPGLSRNQLYEGRDLAPTQDMRALFKAALIDHLKLKSEAVAEIVFPQSSNAVPPSKLFQF